MEHSRHIDREAGREALAFVAPLLERAVTDSTIGQRPGVLYDHEPDPQARGVELRRVDTLVEHAVGKPREAWDADYADYARKKASVSWQSGLESGDERTRSYWSKQGQTTALAGAVVIDGIVVAVSGAEPLFDEVFAGSIALALRAAIRRREKA